MRKLLAAAETLRAIEEKHGVGSAINLDHPFAAKMMRLNEGIWPERTLPSSRAEPSSPKQTVSRSLESIFQRNGWFELAFDIADIASKKTVRLGPDLLFRAHMAGSHGSFHSSPVVRVTILAWSGPATAQTRRALRISSSRLLRQPCEQSRRSHELHRLSRNTLAPDCFDRHMPKRPFSTVYHYMLRRRCASWSVRLICAVSSSSIRC
jgi:hypothetical protein